MGIAAEAAPYAASAAGALGAAFAGAWYGGRVTQRTAEDSARRDRERRREDDLIAVRAAARLLREQLSITARGIRAALDDAYWPEEVMDFAVWRAHSADLARLLDDDEWYAVLRGVEAGRRQAEFTRTFRGPTAGKIGALEPVLEGFSDDLGAAMDVLHRYLTIGMLLPPQLLPR